MTWHINGDVRYPPKYFTQQEKQHIHSLNAAGKTDEAMFIQFDYEQLVSRLIEENPDNPPPGYTLYGSYRLNKPKSLDTA